MKTRLLVLLLSLCGGSFAQYQYYYEEGFGPSWNQSSWQQNGLITFHSVEYPFPPNPYCSNCAGAWYSPASLISAVAVPDSSSDYEIVSQYYITPDYGGTYAQLLRASSDAMLGQGTYYSVEFQNPVPTYTSNCAGTMVVNKRVNNVLTTLASATATCPDGWITVRTILAANNTIIVYVNGAIVFQIVDTSIPAGQPGLGFAETSTSGATYVKLGPRDRTAPNNVTGISSSPNWNRVDLQWSGGGDNVNGVGTAFFRIARNGSFLADVTTSSYADTTVTPNTFYTYTITTYDQHLNASTGATHGVSTPPNPAVDTPPISGASRPMANPPARIGVRPTGAYWGAGGEQIDMLSGNLNFTLPLLKALGRGGSSVGLALNYNSQIWRQDPGGTWNTALDIGYGYGWRLMAGSIMPYWSNSYTLHHYVFTDSTGAEYTLGVNTNGVWTSTEGIYLSYDTSNAKLSFPDGTFWMMLAVSSGQEADGGTHYPTLIQDTNGNQIKITYQTGLSMPWINTSGRISIIEDVRATTVYPSTEYKTFVFNYNADPTPHLTSISNQINTGETYTFAYAQNQTVSSPFGGGPAPITAALLQTVTAPNVGLTHNFEYAGGSAEMSRVVLPYSGSLRWTYRNFTFTGSKTIREVQYRYLAKSAGATETLYTLSRNAGDSSLGWHSSGALTDATGAIKNWTFNVSPSSWLDGMLLSFNQQQPGGSVTLRKQDFTWTQDPVAFNPYIASAVTTLDPATANKQMKTEQTIDSHGNVTQTKVYDFTSLSTPARTYNNGYLTDTNYTSRSIWNRLGWSTVTAGGPSVTLVSNGYDQGFYNALPTAPRQHDTANYGTGFVYRGNLTSSTTPAGTTSVSRYITGDVVSGLGPGGAFSSTPTSATNYAAPGVITSNNFSTTLSYSNFLGVTSAAGQNTEVASTVYDAAARPSQTVSPHGAVTTYSYGQVSQATTNGHWTRTTADGLGRTILAETGDGSGTKSTIETEYDSCACSPLGKMKRVSKPYAPGGTKYWTTYTYDGLGRTVSVQAADGATTTYLYYGNTTTITDPAGKWKKYVTDAMGNLIQVIEPGS